MLLTRNLVALVEVSENELNYNYEAVLQTYMTYRSQNSCSGFDAGYSPQGRATIYRGLYAIQPSVPFHMCMMKKSINVNDLDEVKYRQMKDIHFALSHINKSADPCFGCYEFFKKSVIRAHCHYLSGHVSLRPLPVTQELIIIHDFGVPGFVEIIYEMLHMINDENDERMEANDTHRRYVNEMVYDAYRRVGYGFTTLSTATDYYINDNFELAFTNDINRNIVDGGNFQLMNNTRPMHEHFKGLARL